MLHRCCQSYWTVWLTVFHAIFKKENMNVKLNETFIWKPFFWMCWMIESLQGFTEPDRRRQTGNGEMFWCYNLTIDIYYLWTEWGVDVIHKKCLTPGYRKVIPNSSPWLPVTLAAILEPVDCHWSKSVWLFLGKQSPIGLSRLIDDSSTIKIVDD